MTESSWLHLQFHLMELEQLGFLVQFNEVVKKLGIRQKRTQ